jgi:hypothetical protein
MLIYCTFVDECGVNIWARPASPCLSPTTAPVNTCPATIARCHGDRGADRRMIANTLLVAMLIPPSPLPSRVRDNRLVPVGQTSDRRGRSRAITKSAIIARGGYCFDRAVHAPEGAGSMIWPNFLYE